MSVLIQPSSYVRPGIYIACNDHNNVSEEDTAADIVMEKLEQSFDDAFLKMAEIQHNLIKETMSDE